MPEHDQPLIRGVLIDLAALRAIAHHCEPGLCAAGAFCCAEHDVWIGPGERRRIVEALPAAGELVARLRGAAPETLFQRLGGQAWTLRRYGDGLCVFAYEAGGARCALHSVALLLGVDPGQVKPRGCLLWPLSLSWSRPPTLSVQAGACRYPCNRHREPAPGLDAGVAGIVGAAFGTGFLREVEHAARDTTADEPR